MRNISSWGQSLYVVFLIVFPLILIPESLVPNAWADGKLILLILTGILFILKIERKVFKSPFFIFMTAQLILYSASCIINSKTAFIYLYGINNREDGIVYAVGLYMLLIGLYSYFSHNVLSFRLIFNSFCIVFMVQLIIFVFRVFNVDLVAFYLTGGGMFPDFVGTFGNYGVFAYFTILCYLVFVLGAFRKYKNAILLAVLAAVVIGVASNRTIIMAFLLSNLVFFVFYHRKAWIILLSLATAFAFPAIKQLPFLPINSSLSTNNRALTSTNTLQTRLVFWDMAREIIQKTPYQPVLGLGNTGMILGQIRYIDVKKVVRSSFLENGINEEVLTAKRIPASSGIEPLSTVLVRSKDPEGKVTSRLFAYNADRAHNFMLDKTVSGGLLYALILLFLMVYPMLYWKKHYKDEIYSLYLLVTIATLVFYIFWFPFLQIEPIFMSIVALGWASIHKPNRTAPENTSIPNSIASE